jgi:GTP-binding protein
MLVDTVRVYVAGGRGGNGAEAYDYRGPRKFYPNGGHGGKGGDIIFKADKNVRDLEFFKFNPRVIGNNGSNGGHNRMVGKQGADSIIKVPIGTTIRSFDDNYLIRDLANAGDEVVVARGGRHGCGNQDNKPKTDGKPGEEITVVLDFTIASDIAFVGVPNSGKTTLLGKLTNAKVKVTDYAFSTQAPQLGSWEFSEFRQLIALDLPSIMAGASEGKGLGNRFLKHVKRAKLIFLIIDCSFSSLEMGNDPFAIVLNELKAYDESLPEKSIYYIINKNDLDQDEDVIKMKKRLKRKYKNIYNISAQTGEGLADLAKAVELQLLSE